MSAYHADVKGKGACTEKKMLEILQMTLVKTNYLLLLYKSMLKQWSFKGEISIRILTGSTSHRKEIPATGERWESHRLQLLVFSSGQTVLYGLLQLLFTLV